MIPTHFLDPCSHRVSSVAKRIFISQLASFFAVRIGDVGFISLWFISLRLIAVGFDFRVFHAAFDRGGTMDCHGRLTGLQEDEPRQADTATRVIRIRIIRF